MRLTSIAERLAGELSQRRSATAKIHTPNLPPAVTLHHRPGDSKNVLLVRNFDRENKGVIETITANHVIDKEYRIFILM